MNIENHQIIGELVAADYRTAGIFKKYGIDFCCQGNRTIESACQKKKITTKDLIDDLQSVMIGTADHDADFAHWPIDLLADYIEKKHHRFVVQKTAEITPFLNKVAAVHGERHPELIQIKEAFLASSQELAQHMKKEELILFPFIRKMINAKQSNSHLQTPHFGSVNHPIDLMKEEHSTEGERFRIISELSNNYTPPEDACTTYNVTYALLSEFEQDLHKHIHLENNILFPKAIQMESEMKQSVHS